MVVKQSSTDQQITVRTPLCMDVLANLPITCWINSHCVAQMWGNIAILYLYCSNNIFMWYPRNSTSSIPGISCKLKNILYQIRQELNEHAWCIWSECSWNTRTESFFPITYEIWKFQHHCYKTIRNLKTSSECL